ncbi:MAG: InlB B-repeat-containing protein [Clostridia bacterium]|nr:InlB B-repeat-containing protein [Clostridia bacterium]
MKRITGQILSILLAFLILFGGFAPVTGPDIQGLLSSAAENTGVGLRVRDTGTESGTLEILFILKNSPGVTSFDTELKYDPAVLRLKMNNGVPDASFTETMQFLNAKENGLDLHCSSAHNAKNDQGVLTSVFMVTDRLLSRDEYADLAAQKGLTLPDLDPAKLEVFLLRFDVLAQGNLSTSLTVTGTVRAGSTSVNVLSSLNVSIENITTCSVLYDANGGKAAPEAQEKLPGEPLTLSDKTPYRNLTLRLDANGGSLPGALFGTSKTLKYTFLNWDTSPNGKGTPYAPGDVYTGDADLTLYAQWEPPQAGDLKEPTRDGFYFDGWFTKPDGGVKITPTTAIDSSATLYAHWREIPKTYTVTYDANGGTNAPAPQEKTENVNLRLTRDTPDKRFTVRFDANGGSVSQETATIGWRFKTWNTSEKGNGKVYRPGEVYTLNADITLYAVWNVDTLTAGLPEPQREGFVFIGWFTGSNDGRQLFSLTDVTEDCTLYAHWTDTPEKYTVTYKANGGTGAPAAQTKTQYVKLKLTDAVPKKVCTLTFDPCTENGAVTQTTLNYICTGWNTAADGTGTPYEKGGVYTENKPLTLYAQWKAPAAGDLPVPVRPGCDFKGWFTAPEGGTPCTKDTVVNGSAVFYAQWAPNPYDLGDETYRFVNYKDKHSKGHCFGMAVTSAGYYLNYLDRSVIGAANKKLYSVKSSAKVKKPICSYQKAQGFCSSASIFAGASYLAEKKCAPKADWSDCLRYLDDHSHDGKGDIIICFYKKKYGSHAVNFLRYKKVNGQDRIYIYDSNFPTRETYLYKDGKGKIQQAPCRTLPKNLDSLWLMDVTTYFGFLKEYDESRYLYAKKGTILVQGAKEYPLCGAPVGTATDGADDGLVLQEAVAPEDAADAAELAGEEYVCYALPAGTKQARVTPLTEDAAFIYLEKQYSLQDAAGGFAILTLAEDGTEADENTPDADVRYWPGRLPGDVNGDGAVGADDARLALRRSVDLESFPAGSLAYLTCDWDADALVTAADARLILRQSVGLDRPEEEEEDVEEEEEESEETEK